MAGPSETPPEALHPLLYEINTRCWLAELSERAGRPLTLAEVPDREFRYWQECGFTHVWLMGVWTLGARGRAWSQRCYAGREDEFRCREIVGSPYATCGYDVSAKLGGNPALAVFRRKLAASGLKLILDFIPNHTAIDHPWVRQHPERFVTSPRPRNGAAKPYRGAPLWFAHGHDGHGTPWIDTLQLDYRNAALHAAMIEELRSIAQRCDGVRCDMAMLALRSVFARTWQDWPFAGEAANAVAATEFWSDAIAAIRRQNADFLFLGEVYWDLEAKLQELGFDYTYDKRLYDRIVAHDPAGITSYLASLAPGFIAHSAHFIENHDEPRISSLLGRGEHEAAITLVSGLPGLRLLHEGQMDGARTHANVHFGRRPDEEPDPLLSAFYRKLFVVIRQSGAGRGRGTLLVPEPAWDGNPSHHAIAVTEWGNEQGSFSLVVANLASHPGQCFVRPLQARATTARFWRLRDLLGDEVHVRSAAELCERGLYLDLPAWRAQVFQCDRIE